MSQFSANIISNQIQFINIRKHDSEQESLILLKMKRFTLTNNSDLGKYISQEGFGLNSTSNCQSDVIAGNVKIKRRVYLKSALKLHRK